MKVLPIQKRFIKINYFKLCVTIFQLRLLFYRNELTKNWNPCSTIRGVPDDERMCYYNWMPQQTWRWSLQTQGVSVSRSTNYWYQETPRQTRGGNTAKQIRNNLKIPRIRRQAQGLVWGCVPDTGRYFRHGYICRGCSWSCGDVEVAQPRCYFGYSLGIN